MRPPLGAGHATTRIGPRGRQVQVPVEWAALGRRRPYQVVARRLGAFFGDPRRKIDVLSVHVFSY